MIFHGCNLKSQGLYSPCLASRDRHNCMSRQTDTQTHIHTNTVEYSSIHTTNTYKGILHYTNTQLTINTLSHSWYTHTHTHHIPHKDWHKNTYINEILASIFSVVWACSRTYDLYKAFILKGALQPWPVLISSSGTFSMQILAGPIRTLQFLHRYPWQQSTKLPRKRFLPIASSKPHFDSSQSPH